MSEITPTESHKAITQRKRALLRQPLALQWFEDGELRKRSGEERQAGELRSDFQWLAVAFSRVVTDSCCPL